MLNSLHNHQYTNISSNIDYQLLNDNRSEIELFALKDNILSPEQKISFLFQNILDYKTSQILNYLKIPELFLISGTNRKVRQIINKYYIIRLKIEYNDIKNFEKKNKSKKEAFQQIYELQVPLSINNWFYFDIKRAIDIILKLDRKTIAQLRGIKKIQNL